MYGKGISYEGDLLDPAVIEIRTESGSWYSYNGDRIGQGRETRRLAMEQPQVCSEIERAMKWKASSKRRDRGSK